MDRMFFGLHVALRASSLNLIFQDHLLPYCADPRHAPDTLFLIFEDDWRMYESDEPGPSSQPGDEDDEDAPTWQQLKQPKDKRELYSLYHNAVPSMYNTTPSLQPDAQHPQQESSSRPAEAFAGEPRSRAGKELSTRAQRKSPGAEQNNTGA